MYGLFLMNEGHPVADWLRKSRTSQINPATNRPWSQDHLRERMKSEIGWEPGHSNYSKYESGKAKPWPETLARFVEFWARYGVPGPDLTPVPEPAQATETPDNLIAALMAQTAAINAQAAAINALANEWREAREKDQDVASAIFAALAVLRPIPTPGGGSGSTAHVSRVG